MPILSRRVATFLTPACAWPEAITVTTCLINNGWVGVKAAKGIWAEVPRWWRLMLDCWWVHRQRARACQPWNDQQDKDDATRRGRVVRVHFLKGRVFFQVAWIYNPLAKGNIGMECTRITSPFRVWILRHVHGTQSGFQRGHLSTLQSTRKRLVRGWEKFLPALA